MILDHIKILLIEKSTFMFHSVLSSCINIGLLNPNQILKELKKYKDKVKINSFEGYLRQLFWREYQRYCYIYVDLMKTILEIRKKLNLEMVYWRFGY